MTSEKVSPKNRQNNLQGQHGKITIVTLLLTGLSFPPEQTVPKKCKIGLNITQVTFQLFTVYLLGTNVQTVFEVICITDM